MSGNALDHDSEVDRVVASLRASLVTVEALRVNQWDEWQRMPDARNEDLAALRVGRLAAATASINDAIDYLENAKS